MSKQGQIKILSYGLSQLNVLSPLYKGINQILENTLQVYSTNYTVFSTNDYDKNIFLLVKENYTIDKSKWHLFKVKLKLIFNLQIFIIFIRQFFCPGAKKIHAFYSMMLAAYLKALYIKSISEIDMYHVHYLDVQNSLPFLFLKDKPILMSFWGSDLLRNTSKVDDLIRSYVFKKIDLITIQNQQLAEIVLKRFNISDRSKVRVVKFLRQEDFFNRCKKTLSTSKQTNLDPMRIMVGHNGFRENQHIRILDSLFPIEHLNIEIHLLLSYGLKQEYHDELKKYIRNSSLKIIVQYDYLSKQELFEYRQKMDVLVYGAVTDAMSGTVTEALYMGTKVIAGNWLPYNVYSPLKNDIFFFDDFNEIALLINDVFQSDSKSNLKDNQEYLDQVFGNETNVKIWSEIIDSLC